MSLLETECSSTDRVMDWHDQIFIPTHLRRSVGMDHLNAYGEEENDHAGLLILRDTDLADVNEHFDLIP